MAVPVDVVYVGPAHCACEGIVGPKNVLEGDPYQSALMVSQNVWVAALPG